MSARHAIKRRRPGRAHETKALLGVHSDGLLLLLAAVVVVVVRSFAINTNHVWAISAPDDAKRDIARPLGRRAELAIFRPRRFRHSSSVDCSVFIASCIVFLF